MYVAIRDVILTHAGFRSASEGLAALGLDAVEVLVNRDGSLPWPDGGVADARCPTDTEADLARCAAAYQEPGIHVCCLMVANNFNAEDLDAEVAWAVAAVRNAEALGSECVRLDAAMTGQHDIPFAQRVRVFADCICRNLDATRASSVPLGIENHGWQGNDPEWLSAVFQRVGSPRVGLALDTGNFYWAGHALDDVYRIIQQFAPLVKHVHCKNIRLSPGLAKARRVPGWDYGDHICPVPDGDVDHGRILDILSAAGYDGGLAIEDESLSRYEGEARLEQLRRDVDCLAELAMARGGRRTWAV